MESSTEATELLQSLFTQPSQSGDLDLSGFTITIGIALLFGLCLKTLYGLYFNDNEPQDGSLARSLVILTPAFTSIFWMVQSSLVLSIGLLGSMSFVRFRTPVKRAEDVSFIVVSLSIAIACAIGLPMIAGVITILLFTYTFIRNYMADNSYEKEFAIITFNTKENITLSDINNKFKYLKLKAEFVSSRTYDGITSLVFNVKKLNQQLHDEISTGLAEFDDQAHINIFYPNDRLGA